MIFSQLKHICKKKIKGRSSHDYYLKLPLKYILNMCSIPKFLSKVAEKQTTGQEELQAGMG